MRKTGPSTNIDCKEKHAWMKVMLNICWDQVGVAYWELILFAEFDCKEKHSWIK
ncbi:hypothetical protein J6590_105214, partial [Homalodisca vitripennis]